MHSRTSNAFLNLFLKNALRVCRL